MAEPDNKVTGLCAPRYLPIFSEENEAFSRAAVSVKEQAGSQNRPYPTYPVKDGYGKPLPL